MLNSNGYKPNSLFALEHSLLSNNTVYPAQQFSDEELEESEEYQSRGVEAQAFDWDDAIALEYEEDTYADSESMSQQDAEELAEEDNASSMSWQNYGYTSRGFDLEEDYEAQAFEVEEEETEDSLSRSNSLFALEQSVLGISPSYQPSLQFSFEEEEESPSHAIESQAFDWDDAIALEYDESAYPTASAFEWLPTDESSHSFDFEDESPTYNVEAFEVEDESESVPTYEQYTGSAAYGFDVDDEQLEPKQEEFNNSQAYGFDTEYVQSAKPTHQNRQESAAIPVRATVVKPPSPPSPPRHAFESVEALSDDDFDEFERGTVSDRSSDAEAFTADLAAILRGEKVYEPPAKTPAQPPPPQTQPAPQSQAQSVPPKKSSPHDIFDQMGRNMAHATAFDLGTFSLEQRFDEFDRLLDESESLTYAEEETPISDSEDTPITAGSFAFDDEDLAADVAALSTADPYSEMYAIDSKPSYSPYGSAYAALNEDDNVSLYDSMYAAMDAQEDMEESDWRSHAKGNRTHPPEVAMQMGLLFTIPAANPAIIKALNSGKKFLAAPLINPDLQKQNQSVLIDPVAILPSSNPNAWSLVDRNKKAYYVQLTGTGDLEVHDKPPVPPVLPTPFNLHTLNWGAIQNIEKSPGGVTGGVTILTDKTGQRFFMKGICGTTRRMVLAQYFLSLNPKIKVPQFKRLTEQQFQDLITHSKTIGKEQSLAFLKESTKFGEWTNNRYSEIILMSDVGGLEIEDLLAQDGRAVNIFNPQHAIGKAFFMLLGYILGCDVFVSNPDRLIKPDKHDNWHATLVPANPNQVIQDILLLTLDNESSLLERCPNLTPEEYCELLTTADLTRAEKLIKKYDALAHGQTLEMIGVELIAEPDLNKSIPLRTFIAQMLRDLIAGLNKHNKITAQIKQNIPLLDTSRVDASSLQNQCIVHIILGVNNARDTIFEEMRQVEAVLSKKQSNHFIPQLFAAQPKEIPDLGFNLQALVLRHLYLEHRRHMTVEKAKEDILQRIK